jgi:hypothetical protein
MSTENRIPTKYRIVGDTHWDYIQYLTIKSFLFFWKREVWNYVPKPYYDKHWGRSLSSRWDLYINSLEDGRLVDFAKRWPYIEDYLKVVFKEQLKLEADSAKYHAEIDARKKKVEYLD